MFIGRTKELHTLEENFRKDGFSMVIVYGRRRVGKSTLIAEFIKNKKAIFYTATKVGSKKNLELFSRQVLSVLDPSYLDASFSSVDGILDIISEKTGNDKTIIVIDELPYWVEKDDSLLSILQKYIDTSWQKKNIMLILCGSALSFMENKVLSEKSPLFGRRDAQIKLEPFNYKDSSLFVPNYSLEEKAICFGVTGGVAKYLSLFNPSISLFDNIKKQFFHTDGYLFDETKNLLTQEFSDVTLVNNIIEQIANGENTLTNIASKVKEKESTVFYSLEKLIEIGLVEKVKCITDEKNRKKTQFVLKDSMFLFWYMFIPKAISVIEIGQGDVYFDKVVKPVIHSFMGPVFEEMCKYYTLEKGIENKFNCFITNVGKYWGMETVIGKDGKKHSQSADIDVVGISSVDKKMIVGECKFRNKKLDKEDYENTKRRVQMLPSQYELVRILLFSLGGFSKWFDTINQDEIELIGLKDMYQ